MKITYTERNGHTYAYRCTSVRVPGRKNPVSRREYIGVVDPETGEIIPKKGIRPASAAGGGRDVRVKDRGNVLLALRAAEMIGLDRDLESAFGGDGRAMLAAAVALTVRQSFASEAVLTAESSCLAEAAGLDGKLGKCRLRDAVAAADPERVEGFFRLRESRCGAGGAMFGVSLWTPVPRGGIESSPGETIAYGNNILVTLSEEGSPLSYGFHYGSEIDPDVLDRFSKGSGRPFSPTAVVRGGPRSAAGAASMIRNGMDFVMSCPAESGFARLLVADLNRHPEASSERDGKFGRYRVAEREVGVSGARGDWRFVPDGEPGFEECRMRVRAFACVNLGVNAEFRKVFRSKLSEVKGAIQGESPEDPDDFFVRRSAAVSRFLRYEVGEGGCMTVRTDRNAASAVESEAGAYVILSSSRGWDESLALMRSCARVQGAMNMMRTEYEAGLQSGAGPGRTGGSVFLQFLAVCIRTSIAKTLNMGVEGGMTVGAALHRAASYKDVYVDGSLVRTSPTAEARALFDLFGVEYRRAAGGGPAETMNTPHLMEGTGRRAQVRRHGQGAV